MGVHGAVDSSQPVFRIYSFLVIYVLTWLSQFGCGSGASEQGVASGYRAPIADVPTLASTTIHGGADTLFWSNSTTVGLFDSGRFLVYTPPIGMTATVLYLVDPFSGEVNVAGRRGEGPGEFSGEGTVLSGGGVAHVFDFVRLRALGISSEGKVVDAVATPSPSTFVLAASPDSLDFYSMTLSSESPTLVGRLAKSDQTTRSLIPASDTAIARVIIMPGSSTSAMRIPPYAANDSGFVIGEPLPYRLRFYDRDGRLRSVVERDVPFKRRTPEDMASLRKSMEMTLAEYGGGSEVGKSTTARLDTLEREAIPHFLWPGLGFDATGRVWAVGELGDSTFADVFSETAFLKRFILPCRKPRRRVAIRGEWILLHCEQPESITAPYRLQLYRIVEPGHPRTSPGGQSSAGEADSSIS
jgi:hypothetical protein